MGRIGRGGAIPLGRPKSEPVQAQAQCLRKWESPGLAPGWTWPATASGRKAVAVAGGALAAKRSQDRARRDTRKAKDQPVLSTAPANFEVRGRTEKEQPVATPTPHSSRLGA